MAIRVRQAAPTTPTDDFIHEAGVNNPDDAVKLIKLMFFLGKTRKMRQDMLVHENHSKVRVEEWLRA